ncbi:MAG: ABC transporter substrate-binding protein, partial [Spirochaetales bacterium]|nr:ABC transporter substrate-binding protein [Spirochaetales bacterium]
LMEPLDGYVDKGIIDFSDVEESALSGGRIGGDLYAVNIGLNSMCIVLDVDKFEEAGIPLPDQNWTWKEFKEIALEIHEKLGIYGMGHDLLNEQMWKALYLSNGEWAYTDDGTQLGYTDDSVLEEYCNMVLELMEAGAVPSRDVELALYHNKGVEVVAMVNGDSAMEMMWSNQLTALSTAAGPNRNFYMTHLPRLTKDGPSANYLKPGQFLSVSSRSKNPERAADFINFFTNDLGANEILLAERGVPIAAHIREGLKPMLEPASVIAFDFITRVSTDSSPLPQPDPVGYSDLLQNVYIPEFWDPMAYGLISVQEAIANLRSGAEKILTRN